RTAQEVLSANRRRTTRSACLARCAARNDARAHARDGAPMTRELRSPPRLARWLLELRVPEPDREFLVGDLLEEYQRRVRANSSGANRWFWGEVLRLLPRAWPQSPLIHDSHGDQKMDSLINTFRGAIRSLRRTPALTALVALTLAIGIGATTSVYSVARVALLGAPPYPGAERIALLWERDKDGDESTLGYATYEDIVRETKVFVSAAAMSYWQPSLSDGNETERLNGQRVTYQFFDVLGVR